MSDRRIVSQHHRFVKIH